MDTLSIFNIVIYPELKPKNDIIVKKISQNLEKEWINIYITKCRNIYYDCSKNHPIYKKTNHLHILSHLFYIIKNLQSQISYPSVEYDVIYYFLNGSIEYFRIYSKEAYEESKKDEIVEKIYKEMYFPVNVGAFTLSKIKNNLNTIKKDHIDLKKDVKNIFEDLNNEFKKLNNIVFPKNEKKESSTQTQMAQQNVWLMKKKVDNSTQIQIEHNEFSSQTESIQWDIKDKSVSKKKKKEDDYVIMTNKEYLDMMKQHNDVIKKSVEDGFKILKSNYLKFFKENPLNLTQLMELINSSNVLDFIDSIVIWSLKANLNNFKMFKMVSVKKIIIPSFTQFWYEVIISNKDKFKQPIFQKLLAEWDSMINTTKRGWPNIKDQEMDIIFCYIVDCFVNQKFERISYSPPFFLLLVNSCRNLLLLIEIIKVYISKIDKYDINYAVNDVMILFTSPTPSEVLYNNREKLGDLGENERVLFFLES